MSHQPSLILLVKKILIISQMCLTGTPTVAGIFLSQDHVHLTGRFLRTRDSLRFDWPGWTASINFSGEGLVSADLDGGGNKFRVEVDGSSRVIQPGKGRSLVTLSENPGPGSHSVRLTKITEAGFFMVPFFMNQRPAEFWGFVLSPGIKPVTPEVRERKLEFFGDSAMTGFGVLGQSNSGFWSSVWNMLSLEDSSLSYPALTGKLLDAEVHIQAWSGRGVVKNAAGIFRSSGETMPELWDRRLATDTDQKWDFSEWTPDLVVVGLGHNDFYNPPYPSEKEFVQGYMGVLKQIRSSYRKKNPEIPLIVVCGGSPRKNSVVCPVVERAVQLSGEHGIEILIIPPDYFTSEDFGSLAHLNGQGNQKLTSLVARKISEVLGWKIP